jgi:hypothetical protein
MISVYGRWPWKCFDEFELKKRSSPDRMSPSILIKIVLGVEAPLTFIFNPSLAAGKSV